MTDLRDGLDEKEAYDNTRVSAYQRCARYYWYRHVMHLTGTGTAESLVFGLGWHDGQDIIWSQLGEARDPREVLLNAIAAFKERWDSEGMPEAELGALRSPATATQMFDAYIMKYKDWLRSQCHLLGVEQPFVVPLGGEAVGLGPDDPLAGVVYIGRLDKVYESDDGIHILDHKTTSNYRKETGINRDWLDAWSPEFQIDGYLYGGRLSYGTAFKSVVVEGALVHKAVRDFARVPVRRAFANLDSWRDQCRAWIYQIKEDLTAAAEQKDDPYMSAFPQRTSACTWYNRPCTFRQLCKFGDPNPQHMDGVPEGYVVKRWDPFEHTFGTAGAVEEE